jgi:hypothetical protein
MNAVNPWECCETSNSKRVGAEIVRTAKIAPEKALYTTKGRIVTVTVTSYCRYIDALFTAAQL